MPGVQLAEKIVELPQVQSQVDLPTLICLEVVEVLLCHGVLHGRFLCPLAGHSMATHTSSNGLWRPSTLARARSRPPPLGAAIMPGNGGKTKMQVGSARTT